MTPALLPPSLYASALMPCGSMCCALCTRIASRRLVVPCRALFINRKFAPNVVDAIRTHSPPPLSLRPCPVPSGSHKANTTVKFQQFPFHFTPQKREAEEEEERKRERKKREKPIDIFAAFSLAQQFSAAAAAAREIARTTFHLPNPSSPYTSLPPCNWSCAACVAVRRRL